MAELNPGRVVAWLWGEFQDCAYGDQMPDEFDQPHQEAYKFRTDMGHDLAAVVGLAAGAILASLDDVEGEQAELPGIDG